ncbi:hypothetical protein LZ32DRAFT_187971 [Colletotrichum eremochloae]|nr:hypothetical protein LZ32DRAFT_187971 [Colletotrichum eremochloae]
MLGFRLDRDKQATLFVETSPYRVCNLLLSSVRSPRLTPSLPLKGREICLLVDLIRDVVAQLNQDEHIRFSPSIWHWKNNRQPETNASGSPPCTPARSNLRGAERERERPSFVITIKVHQHVQGKAQKDVSVRLFRLRVGDRPAVLQCVCVPSVSQEVTVTCCSRPDSSRLLGVANDALSAKATSGAVDLVPLPFFASGPGLWQRNLTTVPGLFEATRPSLFQRLLPRDTLLPRILSMPFGQPNIRGKRFQGTKGPAQDARRARKMIKNQPTFARM